MLRDLLTQKQGVYIIRSDIVEVFVFHVTSKGLVLKKKLLHSTASAGVTCFYTISNIELVIKQWHLAAECSGTHSLWHQMKQKIVISSLPNSARAKKVTDFGYSRVCRFRKHQIENRFPELALPAFFKTWFLVHKIGKN
jgi:hypothetical protein